MIKYMSLSPLHFHPPPPNPIPVNMGSYSLPTNADQINLKCWPIAIAEDEKTVQMQKTFITFWW